MYKKILFVLCLVLTLSLVQCASNVGVIKEMAGWWKFDGNADDASGKSVAAKLTGNPKFEKGQIGDCLVFDGVDDSGFIEGKFMLPVYTIAFWFKADAEVLKRMDLVSAFAPGVMHGILLELSLDGTMRYLHRFPLGQSGGININTEEVFKDGNWHHVVAVKDPKTITLWIDGKVVATSEELSTDPEEAFNVALGVLDNERGQERLLTGALDDLRLYNWALTEEVIKDIAAYK